MNRQARQRKFQRSASPRNIRITDRDVEIIRLVDRHRFLQTTHIGQLTEMPYKALARRLMLLYHKQYLDRPRAQIDYYKIGGSKPMVYGIGNKGADLLAELDDNPRPHVDFTAKNRTVGRLFIEHTLLVADVMVALEAACRTRDDIRLVTADELLPRLPESTRARDQPFRMSTTVRHDGQTLQLGVVPDAVFALDFLEERKRAYFFLEADRGTMPIKRTNLRDSSIYKKLVVYHHAWRTKRHTDWFDFQNFRVVFVTNTKERANNMLKACIEATNGAGSGIFLFGDTNHALSSDILTTIWTNGRQEGVTLTD